MNSITPLDLSQALSPGLLRRLAASLYDGLLLFALLITATAIVVLPLGMAFGITQVGDNLFFRIYLLLVTVSFFVGFWVRGGQTLGMRTWRLLVVRRDGRPLTLRDALLRFLAALLTLASCGLGLLWMLVDKDKLAWHDRLSGTQLVLTAKRRGSS